MTTIGEVEGLIDEREVRDDVADDGVLERRPVLPGRIVRVTTADRSGRAGFERDPNWPPPSLDHARTDRPGGRFAHVRAMRSVRNCLENMLNQTTRLLHLIESNRDTRGHVPVDTNNLPY